MPKPTVLPQWATDLTNNTEPSPAQKASGWTPGQDGTSDYDNWVKEVTHRWLAFVDGLFATNGAEDDFSVSGSIQADDVHYTEWQQIRVDTGAMRADSVGGPSFVDPVWSLGTTTGKLIVPIDLRNGDRIRQWLVYVNKASGSGTIQAFLQEVNQVTGTGATLGTIQTNGTASPGNIGLSETGDFVVSGDRSYRIVIVGGGTTGDTVRGAEVSITRPRP